MLVIIRITTYPWYRVGKWNETDVLSLELDPTNIGYNFLIFACNPLAPFLNLNPPLSPLWSLSFLSKLYRHLEREDPLPVILRGPSFSSLPRGPSVWSHPSGVTNVCTSPSHFHFLLQHNNINLFMLWFWPHQSTWVHFRLLLNVSILFAFLITMMISSHRNWHTCVSHLWLVLIFLDLFHGTIKHICLIPNISYIL